MNVLYKTTYVNYLRELIVMFTTYVNGPLKIVYRKGAVFGHAQDLTPYNLR